MATFAPTTIGAAALALTLASIAVEPGQAIADLRPSESMRGKLQPGEEHRFHVALKQGEHALLPVEQDGVDVATRVEDPDGRLLTEFQDDVRRVGVEHIEIVADRAGTYTVVVAAVSESTAPGAYSIRMAPPAQATETDRQVQRWQSWRTQARLLERVGRYADARGQFEQALTLAEAVRGPDTSEVAGLLFELAGNALESLDNQRSRALYERALAIFDRQAGAALPYALVTRSRLALLDDRDGRHQKADADLRKVLPLLERELGPEHPWYLQSLVTLANLKEDAGDLDVAEQIDRDALAVIARTRQRGTILEASLLNNLGDIRRRRGDGARAESLFRQSLAIGEAVRGPDSLFVATELQNLGILARERKDYPAAITLYTRALTIRERLLAPDDASLAGPLTNLANVFRATGDDAKALETHFRALRLWERASGPNGRETLLAVGNIARTYAGMGDISHALAFQRRADAILEAQMGFYVAAGSERQKLAFVRTQAERTDRTISLHLRQAPEDAGASALAALVLLQRKGRVQDAMGNLYASVRQRLSNSRDRALIDELKETNAALARVAFAPSGASDAHESLSAMEARRDQIEAALSDRSAEFRTTIPSITLEAVQAALPGDAVLLEFAVFHPFDPGAEQNRDAYGPPHYAVYVIAKDSAPTGFDLGAAADIDPLVFRLRAALRDPTDTAFRSAGRAIDERIMQPVRASLKGVTRLLVSPDGALNLVPFEALIDEHGRFLIERYATTYVTSGRDLVRMQTRHTPAGRPVIVADPLFGEPDRTGTVEAARARNGPTRRSVVGGNEMSALYFAPLSGSGIEANAIRSLFPEATLLTGKRATKANLEHVSSPEILHIASHGFFLDDEAARGGAARNPLLRSGVALAGANRRSGADGAGILTALEAAGLDLRGTGLVTLSACDTGAGEVLNGEGVYGLRRAFTLAGAEALVMTLWPVDDAVARNTMVAYYTRLRRGAGRGDALRLAKLAIMNRPGLRHPYYWATFIQSGDWSRLPATRH